MIYFVNGAPYSSDYLSHHGILGQRWGVRRWQYLDGTLTPDGTVRYRKGNNKKEDNPRHVPSKARKEKKAQSSSNKNPEKTKEEIIKKGSASEAYRIKDQLSPKEMDAVIYRLNKESTLRDLANREPKPPTSREQFSLFMSKVAQTTDWIKKGTDAYNAVAKVINAFSDDDKPLPIIGEKKNSKDQPKSEEKDKYSEKPKDKAPEKSKEKEPEKQEKERRPKVTVINSGGSEKTESNKTRPEPIDVDWEYVDTPSRSADITFSVARLPVSSLPLLPAYYKDK